ncbi:MAG: hypothetical protein ABSE42_10440 [Bryobacteraceae bacterium]
MAIMPLTSVVRKNWPLFVSGALALLGVIVFRAWLDWDALGLTVRLQDLSGLLAPLAFAAAVIERAVEILVSPWRDSEASKLEKALAAIKARPADPAVNAQNAADLKVVSETLDEYRGNTQRYAFAVSLTLSVLVSMAGVRALGNFVDANKLKDPVFTHGAQYLFFLCVDVALSAALLAGGADGIHSLVNAVTSFFDASADKSSKA